MVGKNDNKSSFDDFFAAAKNAAKSGYVQPDRKVVKIEASDKPIIVNDASAAADEKPAEAAVVAEPDRIEYVNDSDAVKKPTIDEEIAAALDDEAEDVSEEAVVVGDSGEEAIELAPKKKRKFGSRITSKKHWKATVIVIVVVIVCAGAGFWVWHNTPEFCEAICHNPQDPYNPTYYAEPGQSATDKWGNEVEDASSMLAATHRAYGDLVCIDCHVPSITEQITEGFHWITGNFYSPLSERDLDNLVAYRGISGEEFCLNESCHNMAKSDLTEATAVYARNPHAWHHTEYTCSDCHKSHRASILVCSECHEDAVVPTGWLSVTESRNLETIYGAYDLESL